MVVRIDRVTTRGGDKGETSLVDGSRVSKSSLIIAAIGALDETNSMLGVLRAQIADSNADLARQLCIFQNILFDVGADLCQPVKAPSDASDPRKGPRRLADTISLQIDTEIEALRANQEPLSSFVLPGGTVGAAWAHMVRASVRKTERAVVAVAEQTPVNMALVRILNRLSDYFFVLARHLNDNGRTDMLWTPNIWSDATH